MRRFLLLLAACLLLPAAADRAPRPAKPRLSRAEFIRRLSRIEIAHQQYDDKGEIVDVPGSTEAQVRALLGEPDGVVEYVPEDAERTGHLSRSSPPGIYEGVRQLRYGSDGHSSLPLLGAVSLDAAGNVTGVYGDLLLRLRGKLPPPHRLRTMLTAVHEANLEGDFGRQWDPRKLITAVNALHRLGSRGSAAVLAEYQRLTSLRIPGSWVPATVGLNPIVMALWKSEAHPRPALWFDLLLTVKGIPFRAPRYGGASGPWDLPYHALDYYLRRRRFRRHPLRPPDHPLEAFDALARAHARRREQWSPASTPPLWAVPQLLSLVQDVYHPPAGMEITPHTSPRDVERRWPRIREELSRLDLRWDMARSRYAVRSKQKRR